MKRFLNVKGRRIVDSKGHPFRIKGVNCGGWYMMEAYFLHAPNFPVRRFKANFFKKLGKHALNELLLAYYDHWFTKKDFQRIRSFGFNTVRLPFQYNLIQPQKGDVDLGGIHRLDTAIDWAKQNDLRVILDLHGVEGSQNHDWHSDSDGKAKLWTTRAYQKRTLDLWKTVADRYKDEETVLGYDLMNESVVEDHRLLNSFYKEIIAAIRSVDPNHILFIEGNKWATDIKCLDKFDDENYALSIHYYEPLDVTFNFVPGQTYPEKGGWNKSIISKIMKDHEEISKKHDRPIFVGEFGVNYRQGYYGEDQWLKDVLDIFKKFEFHWTYWTFKAVKNAMFPDGIYSYYPNSPWVSRHGPISGWDTYHLHWGQHSQEMVRSWKTESFSLNTNIAKILEDAARENSKHS